MLKILICSLWTCATRTFGEMICLVESVVSMTSRTNTSQDIPSLISVITIKNSNNYLWPRLKLSASADNLVILTSIKLTSRRSLNFIQWCKINAKNFAYIDLTRFTMRFNVNIFYHKIFFGKFSTSMVGRELKILHTIAYTDASYGIRLRRRLFYGVQD